MKNNELVVLADLHANVWLRQNPSPDFRMNQLLTLADRVSQEMIRRETEHLAIAGDLIDSWNVEPKVIKTLFGFFSRIIAAIPTAKIYFVVGQHDLLRYDDYSTANSYIYEALDIFPENVFYMHGKSLTLNNTSIYFSNFSRNPDDTKLNYPPSYHDVWISHVTLGFGHEVDSPNYGLGVFGDIHDYYDSGKNHSVMTPYQHYPHQPPDGKIGIIELRGPNSRFYRVNSDDPEHGFEFLKLKMNVVDNSEAPAPKIQVERFDMSNVSHLIEDAVTKAGLAHVHDEVKKVSLPTPVNFNFHLQKLVVDNFRSVDHLELEFDKLGAITYIQGDNGSGKSTIFNAITTAFVGDKKLLEQKNNLAGKKDEVRIQLWLEYEGMEYYIDRWGKNNVRFKVGDELIELGKRLQQKELEKHLPFLGYFQYFYIRPNSHYWESLDKEEFMRVLFNLNIFDTLRTEATRISKERTKAAKAIRLQIADLDGRASTYDETIKKYEQELSDLGPALDLDWLDRMAKEENALYVATKQAYERHIASDKKISTPAPVPPNHDENSLKSRESVLLKTIREADATNRAVYQAKAKVSSLKSTLATLSKSQVKCSNCGHIVSGASPETLEKTRADLTLAEADLANLHTVNSTEASAELTSVRRELMAWEAYHRDTKARAEAEEQARRDKDGYEIAKTTLADKLAEIGPFKKHAEAAEFLTREKERAVRHRSISVHLDQAETARAALIPQREQLVTDADRLDSDARDFSSYAALFDVSTLDSIPNTILNQLVSHLNTETIRFESVKVDEDDERDFEINVSINVDGKWISYEHASTGQKILMDQFILIRVTSFLGGSGLIMMDEPYTNLDMEKLEEAVRLLKEINSSRILITSHTTMFTNYDSIIRVRRINGLTRMEN